MDGKELSFRLLLKLLLAAALALPLARQPRLAAGRAGRGSLAAHSFELHAQRPDLGLRPLLPLVSPRSAQPSSPSCTPAAELQALPWLREAVCIGSRGRPRPVRGDRADLDLRLLFPPGAVGLAARQPAAAAPARPSLPRPHPARPLCLRPPEPLRRFDQRERLLVLLDRDGRLAALYPAPRSWPAWPAWTERRRTCWAYSPGGHLAELERATAGIPFTDRFDVTFAGGRPPTEPPRRTYLVCHPRRSIWRTLLQPAAIALASCCASGRGW